MSDLTQRLYENPEACKLHKKNLELKRKLRQAEEDLRELTAAILDVTEQNRLSGACKHKNTSGVRPEEWSVIEADAARLDAQYREGEDE